jgi:hypothetical protein
MSVKCALCGIDVPVDDPTYPHVHYACNEAFLKKLEALKVIKYPVIMGTQMAYSFDESFQEVLDRELDDVHHFILTDETVDDDILTMQAVISAVGKHVPERTEEVEIFRCIEFVFDSLMMHKYGRPTPLNKRFQSRILEYQREVFTFPIDEGTARYLKSLKRMKP